MTTNFDRLQLDRYHDYVDTVESTLRMGRAAMHPLALESMRQSLATIGDILDQDIELTARTLGHTSVDPAAQVG